MVTFLFSTSPSSLQYLLEDETLKYISWNGRACLEPKKRGKNSHFL